MLRAVIFDFDGVIADSEPAHFEVFRRVLAAEGVVLTWEAYTERYLGYDDVECVEHVLLDAGQACSKERAKAVAQLKIDQFVDYLRDHYVIMPGVEALLADLRGAQVACSVCSGAWRHEVEFILREAQLIDRFEVIIGADDVKASKPDPEGYVLAVKRTAEALGSDGGLQVGECVAIEDSVWGIKAAKGAGLKCLGVTGSYSRAELAGVADAVADGLGEVTAAMLGRLLNNRG